jgi:hypothetical protein
MSKSGKRIRKVQAYRCENGHFFQKGEVNKWTNSFIELVVFIYLNCLSLNVTINIVRAIYDVKTLSKQTLLNFLEQVADEVPDVDSIDRLFYPKRSGYIALDGVWFKFRGIQIVLLVCFDPQTFDVIEANWSLKEDEKGYNQLLKKVIKKLGANNIKGIYADGDKGLILSLKTHLPLVPFQLCIVHKEMRMGQLVPVKSVNISRKMSNEVKKEIREFQEKFRAVIYAKNKKESISVLKELKQYVDNVDSSNKKRFKKAYRSLKTNFQYTLTHFDHPEMLRDNNLIECFNGIIKPKLRLMKGFKKYENLDRYLKLFLLNYRFHPLKESRFKERRNLCPLQVAEVDLPEFNNFLSFLRKSLNLNFSTERT